MPPPPSEEPLATVLARMESTLAALANALASSSVVLNPPPF